MKRRESPVIDVKDTQPYWATVTTPAAGSKCVPIPPRKKSNSARRSRLNASLLARLASADD